MSLGAASPLAVLRSELRKAAVVVERAGGACEVGLGRARNAGVGVYGTFVEQLEREGPDGCRWKLP